MIDVVTSHSQPSGPVCPLVSILFLRLSRRCSTLYSTYRLFRLAYLVRCTMSTQLLQQFPSLSAYPPDFLKDLLSSPALTEAFLFTLPEVQQLAAEVEKLGRENEEMARELQSFLGLG